MFSDRQIAAAAARAGTVVASPDATIAAVLALPAYARLRRDKREGMLDLLVYLGSKAVISTTAPTVPAMAHAISRTERTVYRHLALLQAWGMLAVLSHGSTPATRSRSAALDTRGNLASIYVFTLPTGHPQAPRKGANGTAARESQTSVSLALKISRSLSKPFARASQESLSVEWTGPARTGRERLWQAQSLKRRIVELRGLSDRALRSLMRVFQRAGWVLEDFILAWQHQPGPDGLPGRGWGATTVRRAAGLLAFRLGLWRSGSDGVLPSPSRGLSELLRRERDQRAAQQAAWEKERSQARPMSDGLLQALADIATRAGAQPPGLTLGW